MGKRQLLHHSPVKVGTDEYSLDAFWLMTVCHRFHSYMLML